MKGRPRLWLALCWVLSCLGFTACSALHIVADCGLGTANCCSERGRRQHSVSPDRGDNYYRPCRLVWSSRSIFKSAAHSKSPRGMGKKATFCVGAQQKCSMVGRAGGSSQLCFAVSCGEPPGPPSIRQKASQGSRLRHATRV